MAGTKKEKPYEQGPTLLGVASSFGTSPQKQTPGPRHHPWHIMAMVS